MHATKILSNILAMEWVRVVGAELDDEGLVIDVLPKPHAAHCSGCGFRVRRIYDHRRARRWRHLDFGAMKVVLRYDLRRVDCARCGVRTEIVPWADTDSAFTRAFEEQVAYLAQRTDKTTIVELMRIAWRTVGNIITPVVQRCSTQDRLDGLRYIGVDELSYRRHHEYITIVTNHETGKIVSEPTRWAETSRSVCRRQNRSLSRFLDLAATTAAQERRWPGS